MDELTDSYIDGPDLEQLDGRESHSGDGTGEPATRDRKGRSELTELIRVIEDDERWDGVAERLATASTRVTGGRLGPVLRGEWLGHALHPMATDLPIGCWTSAVLVDVTCGRAGGPVARRLVGFGLISSVAAAITGVAEYGSTASNARRIGAAHALGNGVVLGCFALSWRERRRDRRVRGVAWTLAGSGVLVMTGYLGGHLAFARGAGMRDEAAGSPPVLDRREAAERLGVGEEQIGRLVAEGLLRPSSGLSGDEQFGIEDVEAVRLLGG
jgi:uncharacterized membrane protein